MRKFLAPRYRLCWWCNRRMRANFHRAMRMKEGPADFAPVFVHAICAETMEGDGGWEQVVANDEVGTVACNAESAA